MFLKLQFLAAVIVSGQYLVFPGMVLTRCVSVKRTQPSVIATQRSGRIGVAIRQLYDGLEARHTGA